MKHVEGDVLCWVVSLKRVDQLRSGLQNADILADSRNKGTFDSKSRKKETPGPRLHLHGSAISSSYGLSTSCETALCWHRQQVNTFQTSQVHRHSCFSMFWQFLKFFFQFQYQWSLIISSSKKVQYQFSCDIVLFGIMGWLFFRSLSDVHCWHEVETLWHHPPHLADHQMHSNWFSKKTSD